MFCWLPLFKLLFFLGFFVFTGFYKQFLYGTFRFYYFDTTALLLQEKSSLSQVHWPLGKWKGYYSLLSKAYTAFIIVSLLHKMCLCKFTRLKRNFLRVSILLLRYLLENYNESWVLGFSKRCQAKTCCNAHEESRARESNIMEIRKKKYNK